MASECSGPAREGPIWGGQGCSMWEHPGHVQQTAPFLFVLWDMFQEGAEVPGEDAKAVGGEGQVLGGGGPGLPYGSVALAPAFSQDLPEQRPHGICCGRREEVTYEFTHGGRDRTSIGAFD